VTLCLVVGVLGCAGGVKVDQEYERDTDYKQYKSWWWQLDSETEKAVAASNNVIVKEYDTYFKSVVQKELAKKGLTVVETNPDILVSYKVGIRAASGEIDWDLDYQEQMSHADVYKSYGGIVVIDIYDARLERRVWHGTGTGSVNIDPTPKMVKDEVNAAVAKILDQFPPN